MKTTVLRQHRGKKTSNAQERYSSEKQRNKALFGAATAAMHKAPPVTLPSLKVLTLEEIEAKYGK